MAAFQRSPSKVWWGDEYHLSRNFSGSLGSQDSGFSDNAADSPPLQQLLESTTPEKCVRQILKDAKEDVAQTQNLASNFKAKSSPKKVFIETPQSFQNRNASLEMPKTPSRHLNVLSKSDPIKRHNRFQRNSSLKVSRSLFKRSNDCMPSYQYARDNMNGDVESPHFSYVNNSKVVPDEIGLKTKEAFSSNRSPVATLELSGNSSRPGLLENDSFNTSESETEIENAFAGLLDYPKHYTSTPKASSGTTQSMTRRNKRHRLRIPSENCQDERRPSMNFSKEAKTVQKWLEEARQLYEPECMTTLQSKSIAAELAQNVAYLATTMTNALRKVLGDAEVIMTEFANIKGQKQYILPLAQSLARLVEEFLENHCKRTKKHVLKLCNQIKHSHSDEIVNLVTKLNDSWETSYKDILTDHTKRLVGEIEAPLSELHVRAALTGLTSIALRNKEVANILINVNVTQGLCVLGEKCESSTVRGLVLRSLSTVCCDNTSIRQLENASGIQLIVETILEETRPEPERSEAVALLAQITAPWIEDNNNITGLNEYIRPLVKSLNNFIISTKCCQNLLLCIAALANLTEKEPNSIKYILHQNSIGVILDTLKSRGSLISVYLLEQVATLIANLSIKPEARQFLTEENAAASLIQFLQCSHTDENVQQRLQQKSIIALSRLSCNPEAAKQIVQFDGVTKLVLLCRERSERHDSDAVLVAALATLRKISEACGNDVIDNQDFQELVKPRLLDSFLTYSTQNESYV